MERVFRRSAKEGILYGVIAGLIMAVAEVVAAAATGAPPLSPIRLIASVVLGAAALETTSLGVAVVVGVAAHLVLSAIFGFIYGAINAKLSRSTQTRWEAQVPMGLLYGVLLWFVNFQLISRLLYPWFLGTNHLLQAALHAVFYGLPLAVMYALSERRAHVGEAPPRAA